MTTPSASIDLRRAAKRQGKPATAGTKLASDNGCAAPDTDSNGQRAPKEGP